MARTEKKVFGPPLKHWTTENLGQVPIDMSTSTDIQILRGKLPSDRNVGAAIRPLSRAGITTIEKFLSTPFEELHGLNGVTKTHIEIVAEALAIRGDRRLGPLYPLEAAIGNEKFRQDLSSLAQDPGADAEIDALEKLIQERNQRPERHVTNYRFLRPAVQLPKD